MLIKFMLNVHLVAMYDNVQSVSYASYKYYVESEKGSELEELFEKISIPKHLHAIDLLHPDNPNGSRNGMRIVYFERKEEAYKIRYDGSAFIMNDEGATIENISMIKNLSEKSE